MKKVTECHFPWLIIWHIFSEKNAQTKEEQMTEAVHLDMEFVVHVSSSLGREFKNYLLIPRVAKTMASLSAIKQWYILWDYISGHVRNSPIE